MVSRETVAELLRVLHYPKFELTENERQELLGDFLPFAEIVDPAAVPSQVPTSRDPDDNMFLELAMSGRAEHLITGDPDLLALSDSFPIPIVEPAEARRRLEQRPPQRAGQYHFDPATYDELMAEEVPAYPMLQSEVVVATRGVVAKRILDLGVGTGITAQRVLAAHPGAEIVGIDASEAMLTRARAMLPPGAELRVARLEDPLPEGPFELVVSALAVHHLDGVGKAELFRRVSEILAPGGRFVLGDVIVPEDPADVVTPIDGVYDQPSSIPDHLKWLDAAGFEATTTWIERDLAVFAADRRT